MHKSKVVPGEILPNDSIETRQIILVGNKDNNSKCNKEPKKSKQNFIMPEDESPGDFVVPQVNKHLKRLVLEELKNDDNILAVLAALSASFALAENEQTFYRIPESQSYTLLLRLGITIFSIASIFLIIRRYQMLLLLEVLKYTVGTKDTLFSTGIYKNMLLEIFINCIISPPGYDYYFEIDTLGYIITYSIDDIITFFILLRLYTILRLFSHHSIYTQSLAERICERYGHSADTTFALKSFMKDSPFTGIIIVFFSISLFSAACMRIAERPETLASDEPVPSKLENLSDNLWVIFYTTTTVGYGNIFPITHVGRLTCIIACIFGNMYLGLLIVAIHQKMEHDDNEHLAYTWICRHYKKSTIENHAKNAIRCAVKLFMLSKKWPRGTISKIKPNTKVKVKSRLFGFDLNYLNEEQFMKKCEIYREMKNNLKTMKDVVRKMRNAGTKEANYIKEIDDTVKIDSSMIFKKIQNMINKETLMINNDTVSSQQSIEKKLSEVKENANNLRKMLRTAIRRRTSQDDTPLISTRKRRTVGFEHLP
ncbi:hypothetical protein SteCoe_37969 [Stentor coeruleus]|uniref:Potassium channel domain-containing protein n=1 Tax=Stentor coeruleus TaxID=5963 RepID=A0A1R2AM54_9CILI|nr:hypothetical protein SteCoe_37969 [Stentor coeruleus]